MIGGLWGRRCFAIWPASCVDAHQHVDIKKIPSRHDVEDVLIGENASSFSSGGVRKLRWSQSGRGKRGGVRVIYYAKVRDGIVFMLTIYAKNEDESIPTHVLRKIKEEVDR